MGAEQSITDSITDANTSNTTVSSARVSATYEKNGKAQQHQTRKISLATTTTGPAQAKKKNSFCSATIYQQQLAKEAGSQRNSLTDTDLPEPKNHQRQVKSAQCTPRASVFKQNPQKTLTSIDFGSKLQNLAAKSRRMSAEESVAQQRRLSCISRASQLSLINNDLNLSPRRLSKMYETGDFSLTFAEQLRLTSYHLSILQQSWPKIKSTVFCNVFKNLSAKNAKAKEMFQKMSIVGGFSAGKCCDIKEHVKSLVETFDFAISELNNNSKEVQDRCLKIGEAHLGACGSSASQVWDDLGDCLTDAIAKSESVRGKREALKAWITLISFLVDSMKAGYTAQCKRRSIIRPMNENLDSPLAPSPMLSASPRHY